jgi:phenylalanyl-tRNA synthetase beta chain
VLLVAARGGDQADPVDGRAVAGILLDALRSMGLRATLVAADATDPLLVHLHPGVRGRLAIDGRPVGSFGAVHPELLDAWDLQGTAVVYGELSVDALPMPAPVQLAALSRFPATSRDLSLDLATEIPAADVVAALEAAAHGDAARAVQAGLSADDPPRLSPHDTSASASASASQAGAAIEVVEDYRGQGVEPGRRALLLRLGYRAAERSVTDDEVQALHAAIVETALAELRRRDASARAR